MASRLKNSGYYKGVDDLKKDRSKSSGNNSMFSIPAPGSGEGSTDATIRFLTEMDQWFRYFEHWGKDGPIPCVQDGCTGCESNMRASKKVLANVFLHDEDRVVAIKLPASVVDYMVYRHEKSGTIRDRDYTIVRQGSGKEDTKYMTEPEERKKFPANRYELLDLQELVENMIVDEDDDDADDDDDDFDDDEDEFEGDDDDDDDEESARPPRKTQGKKSAPDKSAGSKKKSSTSASGGVKKSNGGVKLGARSSAKKSSGRK